MITVIPMDSKAVVVHVKDSRYVAMFFCFPQALKSRSFTGYKLLVPYWLFDAGSKHTYQK